MLQTGQLIENRFRVEAELGRNDSGHLFEALDPHDQPVLIQTIQNPRAQSRWVSEGIAFSSLQSPRTVVVYGSGTTTDGVSYVIVESVVGETLTSFCRHAGRLGEDDAVGIALQILESLAEAHAAGLVHGALTPDRVMLTQDGVRVSGYGYLPSLVDAHADPTGEGTYRDDHRYAAPEMFDGTNFVSPATDVFAVGVMLQEMLVGRRANDLTPLQHVSTRTRQWMEGMLAEDASRRPPNAAEALRQQGVQVDMSSRDRAVSSMQTGELELDQSVLSEVRKRSNHIVVGSGAHEEQFQQGPQAPPPLERGVDVRSAIDGVAGSFMLIVVVVVFLLVCALFLLVPYFYAMMTG